MTESEARKSLVEKLKRARLSHHITKTKLAKQLHVPVATVTALEDPKDTSIARANLYGLSKKYADKVLLDQSEIKEELTAIRPQPKAKSTKRSKKSSRMFVASRATTIMIASAVLLLVIGYGLWQAWQLAAAPQLELENPATSLVTNDPAIKVNGRSSPDASVLVNGDSVSLDENGNFELTVYVQPGENIIRVQSLNAFGNEAIESRRIIYNP